MLIDELCKIEEDKCKYTDKDKLQDINVIDTSFTTNRLATTQKLNQNDLYTDTEIDIQNTFLNRKGYLKERDRRLFDIVQHVEERLGGRHYD